MNRVSEGSLSLGLVPSVFDAITTPQLGGRDGFEPNGDRLPIYAKLDVLVAYLTAANAINYGAMEEFFATYRLFAEPREVWSLLASRLLWAASLDARNGEGTETGRDIGTRCFVHMRFWIREYFVRDFLPSPDLRRLASQSLTALSGCTEFVLLPHFRHIFEKLRAEWVTQISTYWELPADVAGDVDTPAPSEGEAIRVDESASAKKTSRLLYGDVPIDADIGVPVIMSTQERRKPRRKLSTFFLRKGNNRSEPPEEVLLHNKVDLLALSVLSEYHAHYMAGPGDAPANQASRLDPSAAKISPHRQGRMSTTTQFSDAEETTQDSSEIGMADAWADAPDHEQLRRGADVVSMSSRDSPKRDISQQRTPTGSSFPARPNNLRDPTSKNDDFRDSDSLLIPGTPVATSEPLSSSQTTSSHFVSDSSTPTPSLYNEDVWLTPRRSPEPSYASPPTMSHEKSMDTLDIGDMILANTSGDSEAELYDHGVYADNWDNVDFDQFDHVSYSSLSTLSTSQRSAFSFHAGDAESIRESKSTFQSLRGPLRVRNSTGSRFRESYDSYQDIPIDPTLLTPAVRDTGHEAEPVPDVAANTILEHSDHAEPAYAELHHADQPTLEPIRTLEASPNLTPVTSPEPSPSPDGDVTTLLHEGLSHSRPVSTTSAELESESEATESDAEENNEAEANTGATNDLEVDANADAQARVPTGTDIAEESEDLVTSNCSSEPAVEKKIPSANPSSTEGNGIEPSYDAESRNELQEGYQAEAHPDEQDVLASPRSTSTATSLESGRASSVSIPALLSESEASLPIPPGIEDTSRHESISLLSENENSLMQPCAGYTPHDAAMLKAIPDDSVDGDVLQATLEMLEGTYVAPRHQPRPLDAGYRDIPRSSTTELFAQAFGFRDTSPSADEIADLNIAAPEGIEAILDENARQRGTISPQAVNNATGDRSVSRGPVHYSGGKHDSAVPNSPIGQNTGPGPSLHIGAPGASHAPFVLAYPARAVAEQMTLIEREICSQLDWDKIIALEWPVTLPYHCRSWLEILVEPKRRTAYGGLGLVLYRFELTQQWVVSEILLCSSPALQAQAISRFVHIAFESLRLQNFTTMVQLVLGLTSHAVSTNVSADVYRLLPEEDRDTLSRLEMLASPTKGFPKLRRAHNRAQLMKGCVPFTPLFLSDLEQTSQAASRNSEDEIHFGKFRALTQVISNLKSCVDSGANYSFKADTALLSKCMYIASTI